MKREKLLESGKHYFSKEGDKENSIKNIILPILGLFLFFLRCIAVLEMWYEMPFLHSEGFFQLQRGLRKEHIFFISTLVAFCVSLALIRNLKSSFLNALVVALFPAVFPPCVLDSLNIVYQIADLSVSIGTLTYHFPTLIVGTYIILKYKKLLKLKTYLFGLSFLLIWVFTLDQKRIIGMLLAYGGILLYFFIFYEIGMIYLIHKKPKIKFLKSKSKVNFMNK